MDRKSHSPRWLQAHLDKILLILFFLYGSFLAFKLQLGLDESYTLGTTSKGPFYAWETALVFEGQPPLYFVLLSIWRLISDSLFWGRMLSVVFISLAAYVLGKLSKRYLPGIPVLIVLLLFITNPFILWAVAEMRVYGMVVLITVLNLLFFHDAFLVENPRSGSKIGYVVIAIAGIYTQYFLGYILVANALILILLREYKTFLSYLLWMLIPAISLLPLVFYIPEQVDFHVESYREDPATLVGSLSEMISRIEWYILSIHELPYRRIIRWSFRILLLSTFGLIAYRFYKGRLNAEEKKYLFIWPTLFMLFLMFALSRYVLLQAHFVNPRHTVVMLIPSILFIVSVPWLVPLGKVRYLLITVLVLLNFHLLWSRSDKRFLRDMNWKAAAEYVSSHESANQPVLIIQNNLALTFNFYYKGSNELVPLPKPLDTEAPYDHSRYILKSEHQLDSIINQLEGSPDTLWMMYRETSQSFLIDRYEDILDTYIKKNMTVVDDQKFYEDIRLKLLVRSEEDSIN